MQDLTCRFLTGGNASSAFTITGSSLITFKDSSNNTLMSLENAVVTLPKPTTCENNTEFRKTITINDIASSLSGQLYIGTGNTLRWQNQEVITRDVMYADRIAKFIFDTSFTVLANSGGTFLG